MTIPPITHELGQYWDQPARESVLIDEKHALMTREVFNQLHEYSTSNPSGVYEGKMWKGNRDEFWVLRWYSNYDDKECQINTRRILILE